MQEKRVKNREKELYLHELHRVRESVEHQRQIEINERLLKKKSDIRTSSVSPDPNLVIQWRGASPSSGKKRLGRPPLSASSTPRSAFKAGISSFGERIPIIKETLFSLPEFYFNF